MPKILGQFSRTGMIVDTNSLYASPVLLAKKKNGEDRLVIIDFRRSKAQTERMSFPWSNLDDILSLLIGCQLFITIDLSYGYLQVPLAAESREKTAFITSEKTGEFARMIVRGPCKQSWDHFENAWLLFYLDEILIAGRNWAELREPLIMTLEALNEAGLTINLPKFQFLKEKVSYHGYEISGVGIEPS